MGINDKKYGCYDADNLKWWEKPMIIKYYICLHVGIKYLILLSAAKIIYFRYIFSNRQNKIQKQNGAPTWDNYIHIKTDRA